MKKAIESAYERGERERKRVTDSIAKASEICMKNTPGRIDLYKKCVDRLVEQIPPAR